MCVCYYLTRDDELFKLSGSQFVVGVFIFVFFGFFLNLGFKIRT